MQHAEQIDLMARDVVLSLMRENPPTSAIPWLNLYDAICAFGHMYLAQHTDRLENWAPTGAH